MENPIRPTFSDLISTAESLHVLSSLSSDASDCDKRVYLADLSVANPRIYQLLIDAAILRMMCDNGEKLF